MGIVTFNGTDFDANPISDTATEFNPMNSDGVDIQQTIARDTEEAEGFSLEHGVAIFRNAIYGAHQAWCEIAPSQTKGTTQIPHLGFHGEHPIQLWMFKGMQRSPIAYVPAADVLEAQRGHREMLKVTDVDLLEDGFTRQLQDICNSLEDPNFTDVCAPHRLNRAIIQDDQLERAIITTPGLIGRITKYLHPSSVTKVSLSAKEFCKRALREFSASVIEAVREKTHVHNWTKKPDAATMIYNKYDPEAATQPASIMHFGVPNEQLSKQDPILRAHVRNGKVVARSTESGTGYIEMQYTPTLVQEKLRIEDESKTSA